MDKMGVTGLLDTTFSPTVQDFGLSRRLKSCTVVPKCGLGRLKCCTVVPKCGLGGLKCRTGRCKIPGYALHRRVLHSYRVLLLVAFGRPGCAHEVCQLMRAPPSCREKKNNKK